MYPVIVKGTGAYLPERVLTNHDLEQMVDTSDEWIRQRTGILERRLASGEQATSDLSFNAARQALEMSGLAAEDLDSVIIATVTPDYLTPSTAAFVQHRLGAVKAAAFDLNAACTGFVYSLCVASGLISSGIQRNVLIVGAETLSRFVDFTDRNTCILFGDGAGAMVLSRGEDGATSRVIDHYLRADGGGWDLITIPAGGSRKAAGPSTVDAREHFFTMQGREVFKFAVSSMIELLETAFQRNSLSVEDIDLVIPHQVNYRVIESVLRKIPIPADRVYLNLDRYGNTSAASVPIALHEAAGEGRLKKGDIVLLVAFGGGLTWGYNLLRW
ncbi:MAG: ketoacyl-ACP synthase III [Planctomycetes bacterium]|nr:ketoacyl-ACP synthase III [Planctomycetota bacterium]